MHLDANELKFFVFSSPTVACVAESATVALKSAALKSASLVTVRLPRAVQDASTVVIKPLNSTFVIFGCVTRSAVCSQVFDVCRVAVLNMFNNPIEILAVFPVASVNTVRPASKSSHTAATAPRLPHKAKLWQVVNELKIDSLSDWARTSGSCFRWWPSSSIFSPSATQMSALQIWSSTRYIPVMCVPFDTQSAACLTVKFALLSILTSISLWLLTSHRRQHLRGHLQSWRFETTNWLANVRGLSTSELRDKIPLFSDATPRWSSRRVRWRHSLQQSRPRDGVSSVDVG